MKNALVNPQALPVTCFDHIVPHIGMNIFGCAYQLIHIHVSTPVISCKPPLYISLFSALCSETLIDLPMNGKEEKTSIALTAPQQSRDLQSSSIPSNRTAGTEKQELDRNSSPVHKCLKIALLSLVAVIGVLVLLLPSIAYYLPLPSVSVSFTLSLNVLYIANWIIFVVMMYARAYVQSSMSIKTSIKLPTCRHKS